MKESVGTRDLLIMNAYWIGLAFMWNGLHVLILPAVLLHMVPENFKNTYLGLLTFLGLVIAMIVQPISGAISDHWISRWGRRRPLIAIGTLLDFVFLAFLGYAGGIVWIAIGYIGLQFSSNTAHGPMQGLIPDLVPEKKLGRASGVKNLLDMAGLVAALLLLGRFFDPQSRQPVGVIGLIAFVLFISASITIIGVREKSSLVDQTDRSLPDWFGFMKVDLKKHKDFAWLILSRFLFLIGVYGIQAFAQYYVRDVLNIDNPVQLTGDLLAAITLSLMAFVVVGGWLGDRYGHKRVSAVASLVACLGCVLLLWGKTPTSLLIFGSIFGIGIGLFLTANWALANILVPMDQAGKFLGLTNIATAGAGALGRLEGPMIDLLNNMQPGLWIGYTALFLVGGILILTSAIPLKKIQPQGISQ